MSYKDPVPDIQRIEQLVTDVKSGDIRLPKFQRPFVWKRKDVLNLLDSIYRGYPIGSILLWYTSEQLASERTIAELELDINKDVLPTNYLLDGQQRLSTLCGAVYWDGKNKASIWNIAFDLDREEFLHPKDEYRIEYFPLNKLLNTFDFITQCKSFEAHPKKEKFFKNAEKLLRSIKDYKMAVVRIGEMTINEVAPIFERINSTGRKLTIVDLMRAATWKGGFDLNDAIGRVRSECESLDFYNIPETHILRNISACADLGINKEDIDKLRQKGSAQLQDAAERSAHAYRRAISFVKENFPLPTYDYLPYGLQLTFLVELFNIRNTPTAEQSAELMKWFWLTAFSRHFGTSNSGQNTKDLSNIRQFGRGEIRSIPIDREIMLDRFVFEEFRLNNANSKSFTLLLAHKSPYNLTTGEVVNLSEVLSVVNRYEFHHIIPPQLFPEWNLNICVNICLLPKKNSLNIKNQRPSQYFRDLIQLHGAKASEILLSNYIDENCLNALLDDNIEQFFHYRKELIRIDIESLSGRKSIPSSLAQVISEEDTEESDI